MSNGRNKWSKHQTDRYPGRFIALPVAVMECSAYSKLSHPARSLLLEFALQFTGRNNGQLLASGAYLAKRGWKSADVITRAKRDLLEAGFIHETVMGHRPNKASWYAITWQAIHPHPKYDAGTWESFRRGAFLAGDPLKRVAPTPARGVDCIAAAPSGGVADKQLAPSNGAVAVQFVH